ncbi:MAG TPA: ABC transporter permease [Ktedonobacterales bacterium]|jgi:general nucleoside transport system permease protein|nr:ABC transporter permease [Ktedonobacterales bacterium]
MATTTAPTAPEAPSEQPSFGAWLGRLLSPLVLPIGSILLAFLAGAVIVLLTGGDPIAAYLALICGGTGLLCTGTVYPALQISETIVATTPLILTGLSVAIAFRGGLFNIGAEGQFIIGLIVANVIGVKLGGLPGIILIPLVLLGGMLGGMVWGGIVGVLKALTGAHEVVTTIMLNYIAIFFLQYLIVGGPLQLPNSSSVSASISDSAKLPRLLPQTGEFLGLPGGVYRVHAGIFVALLAAAAFWFLLKRMSLGYEIRAVGQSQRAARYAGVNVRRTIIVTMLIAGAFSGLAGAVQMSGLTYSLTDIYSKDSTGFTAIAVSLLGQTTAIGIVLSAFLFGALHVGGQFMQGQADVSGNLVDILQALILFSIAANFLRTIDWKRWLPFLRNNASRITEAPPPTLPPLAESIGGGDSVAVDENRLG